MDFLELMRTHFSGDEVGAAIIIHPDVYFVVVS